MKNLKSSANVLYGFSSGCLIAAALSFFETSELSFTLFCFAVSAFVVAELIENVILPIYSAKLKKRINVLHTSTPTVTITGIIRNLQIKVNRKNEKIYEEEKKHSKAGDA